VLMILKTDISCHAVTRQVQCNDVGEPDNFIINRCLKYCWRRPTFIIIIIIIINDIII